MLASLENNVIAVMCRCLFGFKLEQRENSSFEIFVICADLGAVTSDLSQSWVSMCYSNWVEYATVVRC